MAPRQLIVLLIAAVPAQHGCGNVRSLDAPSLVDGTAGPSGQAASADASSTGDQVGSVGDTADPGVPVPGPGGVLAVTLLDGEGKPAAARVNAIGSDHAYYQPVAAGNPLFDFSLQRMGFRIDQGPVRYYGSFFYADGSFEIRMPAGAARLEVRRGYGTYPSIVETEVRAGRRIAIQVALRPLVDLPKAGWFGIDTHTHFDRSGKNDPGAVNLAKLLFAEGVQFGYSLSANDYATPPKLFVPQYGYGKSTTVVWKDAALLSGHEHVTGTRGHATAAMISELPAASNPASNPTLQQGPSMATVYDQTRALSGVLGFAHGVWGELLADIVLGKTDWVELLQFGSFLGLDAYYLALDVGFRYPLVGASDYPSCRTLSGAMTFVMDDPHPTFESVTGGLLRGESFATSGPLLFLSVDGRGPGSQFEVPAAGPRQVKVKALAVSADLPFTDLELVVNGKVHPSFAFHTTEPVLSMDPPEVTITVDRSSWIAARCSGPAAARAHTNPVWIYMDGKVPFDPKAADTLDGDLAGLALGSPPSADVEATVTEARRVLGERIAVGGGAPGPIPNFPRAAKVIPGTRRTTIIPPVEPRPGAPAPASIGGTVVDEKGTAVPGATVSARGLGPKAATDGNGKFHLAAVPAGEAMFLRVTKAGYMTTNTSYLNPRCGRDCVNIVLMTSRHAGDIMKSREPALDSEGIAQRAWISFDVVDVKGLRQAGIAAEAFPANGGFPAAQAAALGFPDSPARTIFGYLRADGMAQGTTTASNPSGGIQAIGSVQFGSSTSNLPQADRSREPNLIVSFPSLAKDLVFPVFAGQMSYGVAVVGP